MIHDKCEHGCITVPCKHMTAAYKEHITKMLDKYYGLKEQAYKAPHGLETPEGKSKFAALYEKYVESGEIVEKKPSLCSVCAHPKHKDDCTAETGYDHINGYHECGCEYTGAHTDGCSYGCDTDPCAHGGTITYKDPYQKHWSSTGKAPSPPYQQTVKETPWLKKYKADITFYEPVPNPEFFKAIEPHMTYPTATQSDSDWFKEQDWKIVKPALEPAPDTYITYDYEGDYFMAVCKNCGVLGKSAWKSDAQKACDQHGCKPRTEQTAEGEMWDE